MDIEHTIKITLPGPRPEFYRIAEHLWGMNCDIDSDGDCVTPDDQQWTELTLSLRASPTERLDIDPFSLSPLVLVIRSRQALLCQKAAEFIVSFSGGLIDPAPITQA